MEEINIYNITTSNELLSSPITIETTELTSRTSENPGIINSDYSIVSSGDVLRIDIDDISDVPAKGLVVELKFEL